VNSSWGIPWHHADLAFSRSGLARVGTGEALYKGSERCYTPITGEPGNIAVLPARYGVFLAKWRTGGNEQVSLLGNGVKGDTERKFLYPIRKLFPGSECLPGRELSLHFAESHRSEKLRRIVQKASGARVPEGLDINKPPFFRESPDPELVRMVPVGATVMVSAPPGPLVREAWQFNSKTGRRERARFVVPPREDFINGLVKKPINRHYTALMILGGRSVRRRARAHAAHVCRLLGDRGSELLPACDRAWPGALDGDAPQPVPGGERAAAVRGPLPREPAHPPAPAGWNPERRPGLRRG
jgi:hypothetical protein